VQLLVWIFVMRIMMLVASALAYFINSAVVKAKYANADKMNFEHPLTSLVWMTSRAFPMPSTTRYLSRRRPWK